MTFPCSSWFFVHFILNFPHIKKYEGLLNMLTQPTFPPIACPISAYSHIFSPTAGWREYRMVYRGPGFLRSYDSAPCPPPPPFHLSKLSFFLSLPVCRCSTLRERGWARSQIIRRRESLVLNKPFNTLWLVGSWEPSNIHTWVPTA
jgi:hypothetical protein